LGRLDHQIKLRGFRIELGEIEAVLSSHAEVREAVVTAHEDSPGDKRLVAYVVPHQPQTELAGRQLRDYLKTRLPEYMIPGLFVTLESLPLTANGKVNRQALPAPNQQQQTTGYVAPRSQVEQKIAEIWQQALKIEKVGIDDNFFDIGGHSLLIAQVHSQMRDLFQRDIPLIKILEYPTISAIARFLVEEQGEQAEALIAQSLDRAQKQRAMRRRHPRAGS
jgi:non-ribosomal peptide synthetase component F